MQARSAAFPGTCGQLESAIVRPVRPRRIPLRWLAGWLIATILFSQLAVAAYVCPQARAAGDHGAAAMAGMPCAAMMGSASALDPDQPGLCLQHCQFGSTGAQPADPASAVVVTFVALLLFTLIPTVARPAGGLVWLTRVRRRDRAPPPPHSILHCCHRI